MMKMKKIRNKTAAAAAAICALLMLGSCAAEDIFNNLPGENATGLYESSEVQLPDPVQSSSSADDTSVAPTDSPAAAETSASAAENSLPDSSSQPEERIVAVSAPANPYAADYFLDGETDIMKDCYRKLYEGVFNYQSTIELPAKAINSDQAEDFINFVLKTGSTLDLPSSKYEVFVDSENFVTKINLSYRRPLKEGMAMYDSLMKRVDEIVKEAEPLPSDYEKFKYFHDTIINNCIYDVASPNQSTAYGVLCEGRAVCEGYTKAFQLLCEKAGLAALPVYGKSLDSSGATVDHIWNKVICGGQWYNVDVTWDDPVGDTQVLRHDYFLIDDATNARSHTAAQNRYMNIPAATDAYGDFYSRNNLVVGYDSDLYYQINTLVTSQMTDGWTEFSVDFRCLDQNLFDRVKQEYFTQLTDGSKGFGNMLQDYMAPGEALKYTCSDNNNIYSYHIYVSKG